MANLSQKILRFLIIIAVLFLGNSSTAHLAGEPPFAAASLNPETKQVVVVQPRGEKQDNGVLSCWEQAAGQWRQVSGPVAVMLGKNGVISPDRKTEGDGCVPAGTYALQRVFGYDSTADTNLQYHPLTEDDYWVDDPASAAYNQLVKGRPASGSFETMRRGDGMYRLGIVVEYNTEPIIPGKGSAIFIHIWRAPGVTTLGCVAMDESSMRELVKWLDSRQRPVIIIKTGQ